DSGFFPHPDLTEPANRILAFHDVTGENAKLSMDVVPQSYDWHGTMTSVSAAGNGHLSDGLYRGIASRASVVLVKVSRSGKITEENIARGFEWVIRNKDRYGILIVSVSLGGDADVPYQTNQVDLMAEEAVRRGLVVIVAAGNSGCTERHRPVRPANAPSVITVGGYDDKNLLNNKHLDLYCSNFGPTVDGIVKPEIIAPAIWVAAPILPNTDAYKKAEALSHILSAPDHVLSTIAQDLAGEAELPHGLYREKPQVIRREVEAILQQNKIVATHYQHVEGTSFAAPVVASVVAQMLEANPSLTPTSVKQILITTAERLANAPLLRQGYGKLNARAAAEQARSEQHALDPENFRPPRVEGDKLIFLFHDDQAETVSLAGDFNNWKPQPGFRQENGGFWRVELPTPAPGLYRYKFVLNGSRWTDDHSNGRKELDGYGGYNSVLLMN
ncbi:S8 family serine peptidase, partial [bacterium]|nr:S8 family serine peptidase [bacterium]